MPQTNYQWTLVNGAAPFAARDGAGVSLGDGCGAAQSHHTVEHSLRGRLRLA